MERRDFLKLSKYGILWALTTGGCAAKAVEIVDNASKAPSESYLEYYKQLGLDFSEQEVSTSTRTISVYNATDLILDTANFTALYKYFENYSKETFDYQLTEISGASPVRSNVNVVQVQPGNVFIVPRNAGVPPELSTYANLEAFTYFAPQTETFIRVPSKEEMQILAPSGDLTRIEWTQISSIVEACQSSRYVEVLQPFPGLTPPPTLDQRILAQEGYCNAFNLAIRAKQDGLPYSDNVFAYDFVLPGSDGKTYNVRSVHLSEQQFNDLPRTPYLMEK